MPGVRAAFTYSLAGVLVLAAALRADAAPRRVLLLYSYEREFTHYTFASLFQPELSRTSPDPIDFIELSLLSVRESRTRTDAAVLDELRGTLGERPLDLVVTFGGPAAAFAQQYGSAAFPRTPVLIAAVDSRFLDAGPLPENEAAVTCVNDPLLIFNTILRLLPDTKTVMVVVGASKLEQFWVQEVKRIVRPFGDRVTFIYTNEMTVAEMLKRAGSLPPHSAIFYGVYSMDAAGVPQVEIPTLDALHAAADAPMFGLHSHQLGHGIVGGSLLSLPDLSHETVVAALRLLNGEAPASIPPKTLRAAAPVFDVRELHRWGIAEALLEPGSAIAFREPSPLQRYRAVIAVAATFIGAQTLLVIGLVVTLARRRRARAATQASAFDVNGAEAALARLTHRLMQAHEEERARIASTLHDDVCQQLTGLKMRLQSLGTGPDTADGELRTRIEDLCDQFTSLEQQMLALSDPVYTRLEMLGLVASARAFCQRACLKHQIALDFHADGVPVQLGSRVALALFRVLQEAVDNAVAHASTPRLAVSIVGTAGAIDLNVADVGVGFDPQAAIARGAVGLIAMRERVRLVGGTCRFESRPGVGTRVHARAPR